MWSYCALLTILLIQASCALPAQEPYGDIENFITDGENANIEDVPHQVSISWGMSPVFKQRHVCGGAIVDKKWILTTASCAKLIPRWGTIKVSAGRQLLDEDNEDVQIRNVVVRLIHNDWNRRTRENDIALLELERDLDLNERVQVVQLPRNNNKASGRGVLSGWGSRSKGLIQRPSNILQKADVTIVDNDICQDALNSLTLKRKLNKNQICSGPLEGTVSACGLGDLGSPLVQTKNKNRELIGIVTWAKYPCGKSGVPTVYTRVSSYTNWIKDRLKNA